MGASKAAAAETQKTSLEDKRDEIRKLLADATPRHSWAKYQAGKVVLEVQGDPDKYGARSVEWLARSLGKDDSTLRAWASVAETWTDTEFRGLHKRTNTKNKMPLSFWHFVELASETVKRKREGFIKRAFSEHLSVRDLRKIINGDSDPVSASPPRPRPTPNLSEIISTVDGMIEKQAEWKQAIAELHTKKTNKALAADIDDAIARNESLQAACEGNVKALKVEQKRVATELKAKS